MAERETSEWNGAGDYLDRINFALLQAAQAAMSLDVYLWLHSLKLFYREISSVMQDAEREELYKKSVVLSNKVNKYLQLRNNPRIKTSYIDYQLIDSLEQYEIELRRVFKESGLQLKLSDDASHALK